MKGSKNGTRITRKSLNVGWKGIYIHIKDHELLRIYRNIYKISMTEVLHMLIGVSVKGLEEKHGQKIASLEEQLGHLAGVVLAYRDKYGKIEPASDKAATNEGKYPV